MRIEMSTKARERLLYLISPLGLIIIWQILLMAGIGDRRFIPAPSDIAQRFAKLAGNGELEWHVAVTLYRVVLGYIIGAVPAVAVGLLMAMFRPVRIFVDPLIAALFPIPKIALMPLLLLAFGFGDASKIALVAIAVFFPVVVNTYVGAANIETIYWDVAKNYGASQTVMFTRIVFFGALPTIFAGLRIALAVSFIVLVASEFVATKSGIGYLIWNSWELLRFGDADGVLDRRPDVSRFLHARRGDVEALGHLGVIAADRQRAVFLGRELEHVALGRHDAVVEHDGEDGDAVARRGLDVHAGHADGRVAHDVDAKLVRRRELRAHGDAEPVTELGRFAPSHV
jgi:NitT/TauT family transport system permease protein